MIDLENKGYLVSIFSRNSTKNAKGTCYTVTSSFHGKLYYVFGIKIGRVRGKARTCRMFYSLVYWKNGKVTRSTKSSMVKDSLQGPHHRGGSVGTSHYTVYKIGSRQMQHIRGNSAALMTK